MRESPFPDNETARILRLGLLACACDRRSTLTNAQRAAIVELGRQQSGVPIEVILPLSEPLLAWCQEYRPRLTRVITEQLMRIKD